MFGITNINFFRLFKSIVLFAFVLVLASPIYTDAKTVLSKPTTVRPYIRLFYYRDNKEALASLAKNYRSIDILAPQTYSLDESGKLSGKIGQFVLELAKIHNIKVMPLVTNMAFDKNSAHNFLDDQEMQTRAINSLISEAKEHFYMGWQIDFEQMDASYRLKFTDFIKNLGEASHQNGLSLSVAVIAKKSDDPRDYPKNLWRNLLGAYDYADLGKYADFISVMSYDDPESTGPVSRLAWMQEVVDYTLSQIPAEKISLGLPLYYWLWNDTKGKLVDIGGYQGILKAYRKHYVTENFSKQEKAPYLSWSGYGSKYKLWYDNATSMQQKISLVTENRLHGFSAWALGLEVPSVHAIFQNKNLLAGVAASQE